MSESKKAFEKWWLEGVNFSLEFEGEKTFENCSKYFNTVESQKIVWQACWANHVEPLRDQIKALEAQLVEAENNMGCYCNDDEYLQSQCDACDYREKYKGGKK